MARTLTTIFNPFTYEEINAPLLQATQAHQALEEQYSVLADKAAEMEQLRYNAQDADVYREYQNYMNNLQKSVNDLAANGLNVGSRNAFIGLKNQYQKTINPMEKALAERTRQALLQQEMSLKDPTYLWGRQANEIGLREYMNNPNYNALNQNYTGSLLKADVAEQMNALAKDMATLRRNGNIDNFTYKLLLKKGFSADDIQKFATTYGTDAYENSNKNNAIMANVVESAINSSGINTWDNWEDIKDRAYSYAMKGLVAGVGESSWSTMENKGAVMAAQEEAEIRKEKRAIDNAIDLMYKKAEAEYNIRNYYGDEDGGGSGSGSGSSGKKTDEDKNKYRDNITTWYSASEVKKLNDEAKATYDKYRKKGYITDTGKFTSKGMRAIELSVEYADRKASGQELRGSAGYAFANKDDDFAAWAKERGFELTPHYTETDARDSGGNPYKFRNNYEFTYTPESLKTIYANHKQFMEDYGSEELAGLVNTDVVRVRVNTDEGSKKLAGLIRAGIVREAGKLKDDGSIAEGKSVKGSKIYDELTATGTNANKVNVKYIINVPSSNQMIYELDDGRRYIVNPDDLGLGGQTALQEYNEVIRTENLERKKLEQEERKKAKEEGRDARAIDVSDITLSATGKTSAIMNTLLDTSSGANIDRKGSEKD
jgi:hypothetical protein